ncbi:MAG TPA: DUF371 domain-containing protein [Methanobacteriaceae archaeon]|nr:DUF371 domain-containing protein [Methanobacteriaceae archaeon]
MQYTFQARGHSNVTSRHRSTFEVTKDSQIGKTADCIIGVSSDAVMDDIPSEIKAALRDEDQIIRLILKTENFQDEITGYGHPLLTLDHPTDIVCRKSDYTCSRTLMIMADKAACDLKEGLIEDLRQGQLLKIKIIVE